MNRACFITATTLLLGLFGFAMAFAIEHFDRGHHPADRTTLLFGGLPLLGLIAGYRLAISALRRPSE